MDILDLVANLNNSAIKMMKEQNNPVLSMNLFKNALDNCVVAEADQKTIKSGGIAIPCQKNDDSSRHNLLRSDSQNLHDDVLANNTSSSIISLDEPKFMDDFIWLPLQQTQCQTAYSFVKHEAICTIILYNLGLLLWKTNRSNESLSLFQNVLDLFNGSPELQLAYPSIVLSTLYHVGQTTLVATADFGDAMAFFVDAIQFGIKNIPYSYIYVSVCTNVAGILMQHGFTSDAEALYRTSELTYNMIGSSHGAMNTSFSTGDCNVAEEEENTAPAA